MLRPLAMRALAVMIGILESADSGQPVTILVPGATSRLFTDQEAKLLFRY
jgi:hypothetical protein